MKGVTLSYAQLLVVTRKELFFCAVRLNAETLNAERGVRNLSHLFILPMSRGENDGPSGPVFFPKGDVARRLLELKELGSVRREFEVEAMLGQIATATFVALSAQTVAHSPVARGQAFDGRLTVQHWQVLGDRLTTASSNSTVCSATG